MTRKEWEELNEILDNLQSGVHGYHIFAEMALVKFLDDARKRHGKRWVHSGHHRLAESETLQGLRTSGEGEKNPATQGLERLAEVSGEG